MTLQRRPRPTAAHAQKTQPTGRSPAREISVWLGALVLALLMVFSLQAWLIQPIRVDGNSMNDTLKNGEIMLVSRLDYALGDMARGDVVVCRYPGRVERAVSLGAALSLTQHTIFVKRLVALPGDTVEIRFGQLYINGEIAREPATLGSTARDMPRRTLGENEYFVMGDNRFSSHDSRAADVGALSREMILGKARFVIWPLSNIRSIQ